MIYPFTEEQMDAAAKEWGCNCGPSALAFALQKPLEAARFAIPDFATRRYTSPTMMKAALAFHSQPYEVVRVKPPKLGEIAGPWPMFHERPALVRIQWEGPWTAPGSNPRWAYRQTHWIATWFESSAPIVFDCNGGIMHVRRWEAEIIPLIVQHTPRATGGWYPTHIWRLAPVRKEAVA